MAHPLTAASLPAPDTHARWIAAAWEQPAIRGGRSFKAVGRPRLTQELRDVVVRIGSENLLWGYRRIVGELKKLGLHAPPPTLSLIKVQGPRTLALRPSDHGSRIVRLVL